MEEAMTDDKAMGYGANLTPSLGTTLFWRLS
jgi:hypothetical protein